MDTDQRISYIEDHLNMFAAGELPDERDLHSILAQAATRMTARGEGLLSAIENAIDFGS